MDLFSYRNDIGDDGIAESFDIFRRVVETMTGKISQIDVVIKTELVGDPAAHRTQTVIDIIELIGDRFI